MIKYNKLSIENDKLIIDFEVEDKPYYNSTVTITGVVIDTSDTYSKGLKTSDISFPIKIEDDFVNKAHVEIPVADVKRELFIITPQVYIYDVDNIIPCGRNIPEGAAYYDPDVILEKGLIYLKEAGDTCNINREFIDFILKKYALDLAIDTCNFNEAVKYWKYLVLKKELTLRGCSCNGR